MPAMIDKDDMPPRRRQLAPTKEQIEAITDAAALNALYCDLEEAIERIQVDLEFEVGDDGWDARARCALANYRIARSRVERHLKRIDRNFDPHPQTVFAEGRRKQKEDIAATQAENRKLELARSISFRGCFFDVAKKALPAEQLEALCEEARALSEQRTTALAEAA